MKNNNKEIISEEELLNTIDDNLLRKFRGYSRGELREMKRLAKIKHDSESLALENSKLKEEIKSLRDNEKEGTDKVEKKYEVLKKRNSVWREVGQSIVESIKSLPSQNMNADIKMKKSQSEESGVLLLSDLQAGSVVSSEGTNNLGGFNTQILTQRIDKLFISISEISASYHSNVKDLYIFMLGDIIDGTTIFEGQLRQVDMTTVQQVIYAIDILARRINEISSQFEKIKAIGICGNHGRIGKKGVNDPLDNLDYIVYYFLKERLKDNPRIEIHLPRSWFEIVNIMGWNFILTHGDDVTSWMNIPVYGTIRWRQKMAELLNEYRIPLDYMCIGDKHTAVDLINSGIIMNGCFPGGSEFSLKKMQAGGDPSQIFFGVHPSYGKTWTREIKLESPIKKSNMVNIIK